MRVTALHVYPLKSGAGVDVDAVDVEPWGLAGDRRWLVVDADGTQLTAREHPRLLHVQAHADGTVLTLDAPGRLPVAAAGTGPVRTVRVWDTPFPARDAGDAAADWFTDLLGCTARLCHVDDPTARPVTGSRGRPGEVVSAADGYPVLLASTASLGALNDWIVQGASERCETVDPLPMTRFRPNIVIDGSIAFDEDDWASVRVGGVEFRGVGPSSRCVLTMIDPLTLARGKEPIRTLARHRRWDGKTWFALNLVPLARGSISVGDEVTVTARARAS